jgi:hypothetical protein
MTLRFRQSSPSTIVIPVPLMVDRTSSVPWGKSFRAGGVVLVCWGHERPNAVALCLPVYGPSGLGRRKRRFPTGGCAKEMPRKLFVPLAVVPMNVPLSSVTIGQVLSVEGEAKTGAVATQTRTSNAPRKTISAREKDGQTARETTG